jgi:hypothetical protein
MRRLEKSRLPAGSRETQKGHGNPLARYAMGAPPPANTTARRVKSKTEAHPRGVGKEQPPKARGPFCLRPEGRRDGAFDPSSSS